MEMLVDKIIDIVKETPDIEKNYMCHGQPHSYLIMDEGSIKEQLMELFSESPVRVVPVGFKKLEQEVWVKC